MRAIEIRPGIYWVGVVDPGLRDFHGYAHSPTGTTYNAYLVIDEKVTLLDTVPRRFKDDLLRRIESVIEPSRVDYIVVNHVEMDHSGCLPDIVSATSPKRIFCSAMGHKALLAHYDSDGWPREVVSDGQTLCLGKRNIEFMETKMLHWPDNMFSYLKEDRLLVSSDAFGQNLATSERFDDEVDTGELMDQAARYFANIILPFSPVVRKTLESIAERGWEPEMIAPDHGLIWRSHVKDALDAYERWSAQILAPKAVIAYDTMWSSTEKMAFAVAEGLGQEGLSVKLMSLKSFHHSDVMAEVLDAGAVIVGSATLNNGIMPLMAGLLTFMKGLKPKGRVGAAFGSYGWSGEAVKHLSAALEDMKVDLVAPGVRVKYLPRQGDLDECEKLGRKVGGAFKERIASQGRA